MSSSKSIVWRKFVYPSQSVFESQNQRGRSKVCWFGVCVCVCVCVRLVFVSVFVSELVYGCVCLWFCGCASVFVCLWICAVWACVHVCACVPVCVYPCVCSCVSTSSCAVECVYVCVCACALVFVVSVTNRWMVKCVQGQTYRGTERELKLHPWGLWVCGWYTNTHIAHL